MKTTEEMIAVMQAFADGETIERQSLGVWSECPVPAWNWLGGDYRVKQSLPSIDWSSVSDKFCFLASDGNGEVFLFTHSPRAGDLAWSCVEGQYTNASVFSSLKKGNVHWKQSLVGRPFRH